jgi:acetyl esterase
MRPFQAVAVLVLVVLAVGSAVAAPAAAMAASAPVVQVAPGVVRQTYAYGSAGNATSLDVYRADPDPGRPGGRPAVVFVHGGSWTMGDKGEYQSEAILVARMGYAGVSLNYRLDRRAPWPAQGDDALAALSYLHLHAGELGIDPARIGAAGDSAGGQLAMLLGTQGAGRARVAAVVSWSGIGDLAALVRQGSSGGCSVAGCARRGLGARVEHDLIGCAVEDCPAAYAQASPIDQVSSRDAPMLLVNGETELISPRQAWAMDAHLGRAGVPSQVVIVPGRIHGRGYESAVWARSIRFLRRFLDPGAVRPEPLAVPVRVTLDRPARTDLRGARPVSLRGVVRPPQPGSSVLVQVQRGGFGHPWRNAKLLPLRRSGPETAYAWTWTPAVRGVSAWRAIWRGSGQEAVSATATVAVH